MIYTTNMKLKDLLPLYEDKDILSRLLDLYPDQVRNKNGYIKAVQELRQTKPTRTNLKLRIRHIMDDLDKSNIEEYESVDGLGEPYKGKEWKDVPKKDIPNAYAIEYTPWGQWLSMPITETTLKSYPEIDILAYCLWEMTWSGYSNKEIQKDWGKIVGRIKKAKKDIK